jgi:hypothetical protein
MGQVESQPSPKRKGDGSRHMCSLWSNGEAVHPQMAAAIGGVMGGDSLGNRQDSAETETLLLRKRSPASGSSARAKLSLTETLKAQLQERPQREDRWELAKAEWERQVAAQLTSNETSQRVAAEETSDAAHAVVDPQEDERRHALELIRQEFDVETSAPLAVEVSKLRGLDAEEQQLPTVLPSSVRRPSGGQCIKTSSALPAHVQALDEVEASGEKSPVETPKVEATGEKSPVETPKELGDNPQTDVKEI